MCKYFAKCATDSCELRGDFSKADTWPTALKGVEKVFLLTTSALGREQVVIEGRFARAAREAGVRHLVKVSIYAANTSDPTSSLTRWYAFLLYS